MDLFFYVRHIFGMFLHIWFFEEQQSCNEDSVYFFLDTPANGIHVYLNIYRCSCQ